MQCRFVYPSCTLHILNSNSINTQTHLLHAGALALATLLCWASLSTMATSQNTLATIKKKLLKVLYLPNILILNMWHKHDVTLTVHQLAITHLSFVHKEADLTLLKISPSCSVPSSYKTDALYRSQREHSEIIKQFSAEDASYVPIFTCAAHSV